MTPPEAGHGLHLQRARLDVWLWRARFFKLRSLATRAIDAGLVRVNGQRCQVPARQIGPGDVLTLQLPHKVLVVRLRATGLRRGPASEARSLYDDISGDEAGGTPIG